MGSLHINQLIGDEGPSPNPLIMGKEWYWFKDAQIDRARTLANG